MKQRLAEYVADFLVQKGVEHVFSVVGGGAMYLNNALGHHKELKVTYNHHEQASAICAEAYARLENKVAAVCVTTGPGGTNALTGVLCGWLDSIPMFVISGQVRYDTTSRYTDAITGKKHRAVGDQEYDIVKAVNHMTKYAVMIEDPNMIKYELEKAWHYAISGRPGPVWIDIPVDYQAYMIETDDLIGFTNDDIENENVPELKIDVIDDVISKIEKAKRPIIYAGYGIRLSGGYSIFRLLVEKLRIPVVTYWNAVDLIEDDNIYYTGRAGNMGDRPGNWAVQNADLILAIGTRLSIRQVGYNWETWAREAEVIMVDIDEAELYKHTIHVDLPIWADAKEFMIKLNDRLGDRIFANKEWLTICNNWKRDYPVVLDRHSKATKRVNVYAFIKCLSSLLAEESLTAVSNGACCVAGSQAYVIKKGSRMINNSAVASMGYGLPAAIGVCIAADYRETICLEGDGSIMMNLQELQTIITNRLPVKIFLINNSGYHSIRLTQSNLFADYKKIGIGEESGDLSFPEFKKVASAFGFEYFKITNNMEMKDVITEILEKDGPIFCEVYTDTEQVWEPKSSTKRLEDGTLVSPPLEDLAPFLPREELKKQMFINMVD